MVFGFLLTFFSSFGQTFLLSLYVPKIITDFGFSNTLFGGVYAVATVIGSFMLVFVGKRIDNTDLRKYTVSSAFLLMASCLMLAFSFNIFMVFLGLLGLRFSGQGLLSHISSTTISKSFDLNRGKALGITSLGYSSGEGLFPILVSLIMGFAGWRYSLMTNSAAIAMILIPVIYLTLPKNHGIDSDKTDAASADHFSRRLLFKDRRFYGLALYTIVLPFFVTGFFFYQSALAGHKNWDMEWLSFCFLGFAGCRTAFSLIGGPFIDRYSATRLIPLFLIPFFFGLVILLIMDNPLAGFLYLSLTGMSQGLSMTITTSAMAEIFGQKNLGGIRSVFATIAVLGTALSPLLFGLLLDQGRDFSFLLILGIITVILVSLLNIHLFTGFRPISFSGLVTDCPDS